MVTAVQRNPTVAFVTRLLLLLCLLLAGVCAPAGAASARVVKVLPHYLDAQGRHALSPSLFDRDAYQAELRKHPEKRAAIRFDVFCKGSAGGDAPLSLFLEIRGSKSGAARPIVIEQAVKPGGWFGKWTTITLDGETFRQCGEVTAWRATLWSGNTLVSELKSFLW